MPGKKPLKKAVSLKNPDSKKSDSIEKDIPIELPKKKQEMGAGLIILLVFFGISAISTIIALISGQAAKKGMIFGFVYGEKGGLLLIILTLLIIIVLVYGIIKRINWTRELGMVYYGVLALNSIIGIIVYFTNKETVLNLLASSIPPESIPEGASIYSIAPMLGLWFVIGSIIGLLIYIFILVFYYKKKQYFTE